MSTKKIQKSSPLDKARGFEIEDWERVAGLFSAARRIINPAFVYFIGEEDNGPLKIGTAKCPIARLRSMQTGNPRRLRIENVLVGDRHIEGLFHDMWEEFAIFAPHNKGKLDARPGTEWFRPEIRELLMGIVDTAAEYQADYLNSETENLSIDTMESLVRESHGKHDFVGKGRDTVRLLANVSGYVSMGRTSRV